MDIWELKELLDRMSTKDLKTFSDLMGPIYLTDRPSLMALKAILDSIIFKDFISLKDRMDFIGLKDRIDLMGRLSPKDSN